MVLNYERLVVPVSGTPADERALAVAHHLGPSATLALTLIYVVEVAQSMPLDAELPASIAHGDATIRHAEEVSRQMSGSKRIHVTSELLQARSIGAAIVDEAIDRNADAIVMTAAVQRKHGRPTIGETVNYVLINAPCEVVVVRVEMPGLVTSEPEWS